LEKNITKIDNRGRILIPKKIREKLMLKKGDILTLKVIGQDIVLSPVRRPKKVRARKFEKVFFDAGEATFGE